GGLADALDRETEMDRCAGCKPLFPSRSPDSWLAANPKIGDVELHLDGHMLLIRGTPICLPHKEFVILQQLMNNAGRVVTRRELLDNAWNPDQADVRNYLEVHIRRLRTKIETDPNKPTRIRTVRGIGHIFDLPQ